MPDSSVGVTAVYTQSVTGRPPFQAAVPIGEVYEPHFFMPFDNTGGLTTTLALVNATLSTESITMIAHAASGLALCVVQESLASGQHQAFILADKLPCVKGTTGSLEVLTNFGVSAIAFLFQDFGAFTTILPMIQLGQ